MNSKQDGGPRLDPGESILPRKRHTNLQMEANVYQQATNLQPPLDPPQPLDPAQPPADAVIAKLLGSHFNGHALVKRPTTSLGLALRIARAAAKDSQLQPETELCQPRSEG